MLTIVVIIAISIALLMPSLARARENARRLVCAVLPIGGDAGFVDGHVVWRDYEEMSGYIDIYYELIMW